MTVPETSEKNFEEDIARYFWSPEGGYTRNSDAYDPELGLFPETLVRFVKASQPKAWQRFANMNAADPAKRFCRAFANACDMDGVLHVLRHGFKHRGVAFRVCYFKPESELNELDAKRWGMNELTCNRQWFYSAAGHNSVDMVLAVNGIPVFAFELKNQFTGQSVKNAMEQWKKDRDPREPCFRFNSRVLAFFCVDLAEAWMATRLAKDKTVFCPSTRGAPGRAATAARATRRTRRGIRRITCGRRFSGRKA